MNTVSTNRILVHQSFCYLNGYHEWEDKANGQEFQDMRCNHSEKLRNFDKMN